MSGGYMWQLCMHNPAYYSPTLPNNPTTYNPTNSTISQPHPTRYDNNPHPSSYYLLYPKYSMNNLTIPDPYLPAYPNTPRNPL